MARLLWVELFVSPPREGGFRGAAGSIWNEWEIMATPGSALTEKVPSQPHWIALFASCLSAATTFPSTVSISMEEPRMKLVDVHFRRWTHLGQEKKLMFRDGSKPKSAVCITVRISNWGGVSSLLKVSSVHGVSVPDGACPCQPISEDWNAPENGGLHWLFSLLHLPYLLPGETGMQALPVTSCGTPPCPWRHLSCTPLLSAAWFWWRYFTHRVMTAPTTRSSWECMVAYAF